MSYIQEFEAELVQKLESGSEDTTNIVRQVSEKVLESYRNGITAGQKGTQVKRQGQSRRRGYFGKAEQSFPACYQPTTTIMGIDIYAHWRGQTDEAKAEQGEAWLTTGAGGKG